MFSAVKKPLSSPMKSGQRLAEGDPTVPTVTVSTARTGATDISVAATKPSAARPSVLIIYMVIPSISIAHLRDVRQKQTICGEIRRNVAQLLQGIDDLAQLRFRDPARRIEQPTDDQEFVALFHVSRLEIAHGYHHVDRFPAVVVIAQPKNRFGVGREEFPNSGHVARGPIAIDRDAGKRHVDEIGRQAEIREPR